MLLSADYLSIFTAWQSGIKLTGLQAKPQTVTVLQARHPAVPAWRQ